MSEFIIWYMATILLLGIIAVACITFDMMTYLVAVIKRPLISRKNNE